MTTQNLDLATIEIDSRYVILGRGRESGSMLQQMVSRSMELKTRAEQERKEKEQQANIFKEEV